MFIIIGKRIWEMIYIENSLVYEKRLLRIKKSYYFHLPLTFQLITWVLLAASPPHEYL